ncbi:hypothetical protein PT974_10842 [Cladobotryum mycophilum]|uniref:Uncharacterized protein n=1 Tax=Cladobotryum mycophilum TaxID=491253 RepID=A0ABR0SBY1_9HYPO
MLSKPFFILTLTLSAFQAVEADAFIDEYCNYTAAMAEKQGLLASNLDALHEKVSPQVGTVYAENIRGLANTSIQAANAIDKYALRPLTYHESQIINECRSNYVTSEYGSLEFLHARIHFFVGLEPEMKAAVEAWNAAAPEVDKKLLSISHPQFQESIRLDRYYSDKDFETDLVQDLGWISMGYIEEVDRLRNAAPVSLPDTERFIDCFENQMVFPIHSLELLQSKARFFHNNAASDMKAAIVAWNAAIDRWFDAIAHIAHPPFTIDVESGKKITDDLFDKTISAY